MAAGKFTGFVRDLFIALLWGIFSFWFALGGASLHVKCEMQSDGTYSCEAKHEIFEVGVTSSQANQVVETKRNTQCSGPDLDRKCTYVPYFVTKAGEEIEMSTRYTSSIDKVDALVQAINTSIDLKEPIIDHTGAGSWAVFQICLLSLSPFIFLLAILKLFKKPGTGPRTIISWKQKQDSP